MRKGKYDKLYVWTGEHVIAIQEHGIAADGCYIYQAPFNWEQIIGSLWP